MNVVVHGKKAVVEEGLPSTYSSWLAPIARGPATSRHHCGWAILDTQCHSPYGVTHSLSCRHGKPGQGKTGFDRLGYY